MIDLLVLGIGSPFQDDQLGWEVVRSLQLREGLQHVPSTQLQFVCVDRPGMRLLNWMTQAQTVFLIDALKTTAPSGRIHCFQEDALETIDSVCSSHDFGVAEAIKLGKVLNCLPKQITFYGISMNELEFGAALSPVIVEAIEQLVVRIEADILT